MTWRGIVGDCVTRIDIVFRLRKLYYLFGMGLPCFEYKARNDLNTLITN